MKREKSGNAPDITDRLAQSLGTLDANALIKAMPSAAAFLGRMMAEKALPLLRRTGVGLDRAEPELRMRFRDQASGIEFAIVLSIEEIEDEAETEEGQ